MLDVRKRLSALPDELAVACLAPGHVLEALRGSALLAPAVADDCSHAFLSVGCLMSVMAMQRVDEPVAGFDDGVVPVSVGDQTVWILFEHDRYGHAGPPFLSLLWRTPGGSGGVRDLGVVRGHRQQHLEFVCSYS